MVTLNQFLTGEKRWGLQGAYLYLIVTDNTGALIVIEYVGGILKIHDHKVGVVTNSPNYEWHFLNLRNYPQLITFGNPGDRQIQGVSLAPFGAGSGMLGLPGDVTLVSRFVRAVAFTQTLITPENAEAGVNEASRILNNFDIPRGWLGARGRKSRKLSP